MCNMTHSYVSSHLRVTHICHPDASSIRVRSDLYHSNVSLTYKRDRTCSYVYAQYDSFICVIHTIICVTHIWLLYMCMRNMTHSHVCMQYDSFTCMYAIWLIRMCHSIIFVTHISRPYVSFNCFIHIHAKCTQNMIYLLENVQYDSFICMCHSIIRVNQICHSFVSFVPFIHMTHTYVSFIGLFCKRDLQF